MKKCFLGAPGAIKSSYPFSVATHSELSIAKVTLREKRKKIENNIFHFLLSLNALSMLLFFKNPGGK